MGSVLKQYEWWKRRSPGAYPFGFLCPSSTTVVPIQPAAFAGKSTRPTTL